MKCFCRKKYYDMLDNSIFYKKRNWYEYRKEFEFDELFIYWVQYDSRGGVGFEEKEFRKFFYTKQDLRKLKIKKINKLYDKN